MTDIAHLKFDDDVYGVVLALQRYGELFARDARELYEDAPAGWFLVGMMLDKTADLVVMVQEINERFPSLNVQLLAAKLAREGEKVEATFLHLRGLAHTLQ